MSTQNLEKLFSLCGPKAKEFEFLTEYNNHLMHRIDEMKLHSFHKEEVKAVLQQALVEIAIYHRTSGTSPKNRHWILRLLQKTAR